MNTTVWHLQTESIAAICENQNQKFSIVTKIAIINRKISKAKRKQTILDFYRYVATVNQ